MKKKKTMIDKYCKFAFFCKANAGKRTVKNRLVARYLARAVKRDLQNITDFTAEELLELTWIIKSYRLEYDDDDVFLDKFTTVNADSFCKIEFKDPLKILGYEIKAYTDGKIELNMFGTESTLRTDCDSISKYKKITQLLSIEFGYTINTILNSILKEANL